MRLDILLVVYFLVSLLDTALTQIGITQFGAREVGGLRFLSLSQLIIVKTILFLGIGTYLYLRKRKKTLNFACIVTGGVSIWNFIHLINS